MDFFLILSQIGGFAVYSLFTAQNLQTVLASNAYGIDWDYRVFLAITLVPVLMLCSIRNLANLSWVMVIANLFEFYVIAVVFYYLFREPLPSLEGKDLVAPLDKLPISFGSGKKAKFFNEGHGQGVSTYGVMLIGSVAISTFVL